MVQLVLSTYFRSLVNPKWGERNCGHWQTLKLDLSVSWLFITTPLQLESASAVDFSCPFLGEELLSLEKRRTKRERLFLDKQPPINRYCEIGLVNLSRCDQYLDYCIEQVPSILFLTKWFMHLVPLWSYNLVKLNDRNVCGDGFVNRIESCLEWNKLKGKMQEDYYIMRFISLVVSNGTV